MKEVLILVIAFIVALIVPWPIIVSIGVVVAILLLLTKG